MAAAVAAFCRFLRPAVVTCVVPLAGQGGRDLVCLAPPLARGGYGVVVVEAGDGGSTGRTGGLQQQQRATACRRVRALAGLESPDEYVRLALAACETEPRRVALLVDGHCPNDEWPWAFTQKQLLDAALSAGLRAAVFNAEGFEPVSPPAASALQQPAPLLLLLPAPLTPRDAVSALVAGVESAAGGNGAGPPALGFGPHKIPASHVFAASRHCFALTNLKPVTPGHVLVVSRRCVPRLRDLTRGEAADLWLAVQAVGERLEAHLGGASVTVALQDGPAAGQTVPHVHVHVLPRHVGDLEDNDAVYGMVRACGSGGEAAALEVAVGRLAGVGRRARHPSATRPPVQIEESSEALRSPLAQPPPRRGSSSGSGSRAIVVDPIAVHGSKSGGLAAAGAVSGLDGGSAATPIEERIVRGKPLQVPAVRHPRTAAAMAAEAAEYRALFPNLQWDVQQQEEEEEDKGVTRAGDVGTPLAP